MENNKKVSILDLLKRNSKTYQLGTQGVTQEVSGLKAKDWKDEIIYNGEVNRKFSQMVENDYTLTTQQGNSLILGIEVPILLVLPLVYLADMSLNSVLANPIY